MNPFKTFFVMDDWIEIDDVIVMRRPKYVTRSEWIEYWDRAKNVGAHWP